jgi:hypothetical protein
MACFEKKIINSLVDLICYSIVFMKYWAGLNSLADSLIIAAMGVRSSMRGCVPRIEDARASRANHVDAVGDNAQDLDDRDGANRRQ